MSRETLYLLPVLLPSSSAASWSCFSRSGTWLPRRRRPPTFAGVTALLSAALFCEAFPVPVENLPGGRLSLSTVFILGAAVLYGWEAAVAVAVLTRGTLEIVERRPRVKLYFNCAVFALAAAAAGAAMSPFERSGSTTQARVRGARRRDRLLRRGRDPRRRDPRPLVAPAVPAGAPLRRAHDRGDLRDHGVGQPGARRPLDGVAARSRSSSPARSSRSRCTSARPTTRCARCGSRSPTR